MRAFAAKHGMQPHAGERLLIESLTKDSLYVRVYVMLLVALISIISSRPLPTALTPLRVENRFEGAQTLDALPELLR